MDFGPAGCRCVCGLRGSRSSRPGGCPAGDGGGSAEFVRVLRPGPFKAWAIGVARNQIRLYLRRRSRDRLVFGEDTITTLESTFEKALPPEELDYLPGCIDQLEGRARTLCDLRYQDGLKPAAISKKVGMTANSVAKALQRIREQLRACIEGRLASEGGAR